MSSGRMITCGRCGQRKRHKAKGRCSPCYRLDRREALGLYPREFPECRVPSCLRVIYGEGLDVCGSHVPDALGITYRQLDHWVRSGYLRPSHFGGSGSPRSWPPAEVEIAKRMASLTGAGLNPAVAAAFARGAWPSGEIAPGIRVEVSQ